MSHYKMNGRIGLALCGGGAKGSYQIGVWKALEELKMIKDIKAVSGTSVGALNAVLFAIGDFDSAKSIWTKIAKADLLSVNNEMAKGIFSRDGLKSIIRKVPLNQLKKTIPVFVNIVEEDSYAVKSIKLNGLSQDEITKYLLASSAIPVIYEPVIINGKGYMDGGTVEQANVPLKALYENGYKNIIVSALKKKININRPDYPDAEIKILYPSGRGYSTVFNTFDFTKVGIFERMAEGYSDTMNALRGNSDNMKKAGITTNSQIIGRFNELFRNEENIEDFLRVACLNMNIKWRIQDLNWYIPIWNLGKWRLEQGIANHNHYRLISPEGFRCAWVLSPNKLLNTLDDYEAMLKLR